MAALVAVFALVTAACGSRLTPQQRAQGIRLIAGQNGGTTAGTGGGTTTTGGGGGGSVTGGGGGTSGGGGGTKSGGGGGGGSTTTTTGGGGGGGGGGHSSGSGSSGGGGHFSGNNGGATDTGVTGTQINLATIYNGQGPEPGIFVSAYKATEAAAAYINSTGGIYGRNLKIDPIDDHTNSTDNRAAVEQACAHDFAMVGSMSAFDDGGVPVADKCKIPDMPAIPVTASHELDKNVHAAYPNRPDYFIEGFPNYIKQHYPGVIKNAGIMWLNASATQTNEAAREKAYTSDGFSFVYRQQVQVVEPNFAPYVAAMRQKGVQYLTMVSDYQSIARLLQAMQQQNWFPQVMDWDSVVYDQNFLQLAGPAANNSLFYMDVAPLEEASQNKEVALYEYWLNKTCSGQGCTPTYFGEYAWSAIRLFQKAALDAGPKLTRSALIAAVEKIHAWNDYGLSATHDPGRELPSPCIFYGKIENGKFVRLFPSSGFACNEGGLLHQSP